jgi:hypothetical protein
MWAWETNVKSEREGALGSSMNLVEPNSTWIPPLAVTVVGGKIAAEGAVSGIKKDFDDPKGDEKRNESIASDTFSHLPTEL